MNKLIIISILVALPNYAKAQWWNLFDGTFKISCEGRTTTMHPGLPGSSITQSESKTEEYHFQDRHRMIGDIKIPCSTWSKEIIICRDLLLDRVRGKIKESIKISGHSVESTFYGDCRKLEGRKF